MHRLLVFSKIDQDFEEAILFWFDEMDMDPLIFGICFHLFVAFCEVYDRRIIKIGAVLDKVGYCLQAAII